MASLTISAIGLCFFLQPISCLTLPGRLRDRLDTSFSHPKYILGLNLGPVGGGGLLAFRLPAIVTPPALLDLIPATMTLPHLYASSVSMGYPQSLRL